MAGRIKGLGLGEGRGHVIGLLTQQGAVGHVLAHRGRDIIHLGAEKQVTAARLPAPVLDLRVDPGIHTHSPVLKCHHSSCRLCFKTQLWGQTRAQNHGPITY